jgi:hypothetical protein
MTNLNETLLLTSDYPAAADDVDSRLMDTEMVANDTIGGICVEHYDYYQPTE